MSEKGAEDIGATVADTHTAVVICGAISLRFQSTAGRAHVFPHYKRCVRLQGQYMETFFFFKFCTDSSIYPLLMLHSFVTRRSSLSHQSEGKHVPFVKTGGIHCEGLSGMRGLRSGRRVSLAANPQWRSGYLWCCVLWRRAGLWGCGIARLRSSTFAVERRKCISGTIYSSWDNSCVPHDILLLVVISVHCSTLTSLDMGSVNCPLLFCGHRKLVPD